jgi:AcrR family transcriptional regulator
MAQRRTTSTPAPSRAGTRPGGAAPAVGERPLVERAINRAVAEQYAQAAEEVDRIIEATYRVMAREGSVEPKIRDILQEAELATQAFYRHFASKDELLLVILDDGRRRLAEYLAHRMSKATDPVDRVTAWVEGMLAQAADPEAASRTRPFIIGLQRLSDLYPSEQQASVDLLVTMLAEAIGDGIETGEFGDRDARRSAELVYQLTVAVMEDHVLRRVGPNRAEVRDVVAFALRALSP